MNHSRLFAILLFWPAALLTSAALPPDQALSEDQSHSVEVTSANDAEVEVVVSRQDAEGRSTLAWAQQVEWRGHSRWTGMIKPLVSNDGGTVILRDQNPSFRERDQIKIVRRGGVTEVPAFLLEQLTAEDQRPRGAPAYLFDTRLEFIHEEEGLYALWSGARDRWLTIGLNDVACSIASDPAKIAELNSVARSLALETVREHQPGLIKKTIASWRERLGKMIPSLSPSRTSRWASQEATAAYIFLTLKKDPEARRYIEGLLQQPADRASQMPILGGYSPLLCELSASQRVLGDFLLRWLDEPEANLLFAKWHLVAPKDDLEYLASFRVDVRLPLPANAEEAGDLWVYLIPAGTPDGKWAASTGIIPLRLPLRSALQRVRPGNSELDLRGAGFIFVGMHPGDCRVKAVWDRRAPMALPTERVALPSPGDYESIETEAFTLAPGTITNFVLNCTNRTAGGEAYYAADELRRQMAGGPADETLSGYDYPLLFTATIEKWIVESNPEAGLDLHDAAILESPNRFSASDMLELRFKSSRPTLWPDLRLQHYELRILDSTGQAFTSTSRGRGMRPPFDLLVANFDRFPRRGRFEVQVWSPSHLPDHGLLASYTLTNLANFFASGSEPLEPPLRKEIRDLVVEIPGFSGFRLDPDLRVTDLNGQWRRGWEAAQVVLRDTAGNELPDMRSITAGQAFRVESEFIYPGMEDSANFVVPLKAIPGDGEWRTLEETHEFNGLRFELLAITGKGQFRYQRDQIVAAAPEPDTELRPRGSQLPTEVGEEVRLVYWAEEEESGVAGTVVSRVPHLALRIHGAGANVYWRLLEERVPVWRRVNAETDGQLWLIPVNRTKQAETTALTFTFQEAIRTDFHVRAPADWEYLGDVEVKQ